MFLLATWKLGVICFGSFGCDVNMLPSAGDISNQATEFNEIYLDS